MSVITILTRISQTTVSIDGNNASWSRHQTRRLLCTVAAYIMDLLFLYNIDLGHGQSMLHDCYKDDHSTLTPTKQSNVIWIRFSELHFGYKNSCVTYRSNGDGLLTIWRPLIRGQMEESGSAVLTSSCDDKSKELLRKKEKREKRGNSLSNTKMTVLNIFNARRRLELAWLFWSTLSLDALKYS